MPSGSSKDEDGREITLLGGHAAADQVSVYWLSKSPRLPSLYIHTWPYAHSVPPCAKFHSHRTYRIVIIARRVVGLSLSSRGPYTPTVGSTLRCHAVPLSVNRMTINIWRCLLGSSCQGYRARFHLQRVQCECDRKGERKQNNLHVAAVDGTAGRPANVASLTVPTEERCRLIALDTLVPRYKSCRPWLAYIFEFV